MKHQAELKHQMAYAKAVFAATGCLTHSAFAAMAYAMAVFAPTTFFTHSAFAEAAGLDDASVAGSSDPASEFSDPASNGNGASHPSTISVDEQFIPDALHVTNLISGDSDLAADISLYDRVTGRIKKVGISFAGAEENGASLRPAMSGDGHDIVFQSEAATNPVERDINSVADVFVYDRGTGQMSTASLGIHDTPAKGPSLEEPSMTFTPEEYGAVGDGTTDDTQAFKAMHAAIMAAQEAEPNLRVTIEFAPNAEYTYTWNRWSLGIKYLTLEGNGACICNTHAGPWHTDMTTWRTNRGALEGNADENIGHLIDTAQAGAMSVTLKDFQHASEFDVGKWVLVASYSQQNGGWPPNARYFDYAKVKSIKDGVISLDRKLAYEHRDDWPTRGAVDEIAEARIIPTERDIPWAEHWVIRDLRALRNPHCSGGGVIQIESFDRMEFDNVDFPHWAGDKGRELIFRNSVITRSEPGNLLTKLQIEDDRLPQEVVFAGAVGAEGPAGTEQSAEELVKGRGGSLLADPSEVDHALAPADFRTHKPPVPNLPGPGPDLVAPAGAPAAPGEQYFRGFIGSPAAGAPVIAAWHDTLMSNESFTLAGKYFTTKTGEAEGSDTTVWVGAQTPSGYRVLEADLISVEEKLLTATVPAELPYDMYLVWVENAHGAGLPIAVNQAQARWLGPLGNKAAPGATKRLFGKGLSRDPGTSEAHLYLEADGEWTSLSIGEITPYSVEFLVPSTLAPGIYKIYAHNGHGGQYGWSKPLDLDVRDSFVRGTFEISVPPSGIDDTDAIRSAINSVMKQPAGGIVRLESGTYVISDQVTVGSNVRLIGNGKNNTEVIVEFSSTADNDARSGILFSGDHIELQGFTLKLALGAMMPLYAILDTGSPTPCNDCRIADLRWTSEDSAYSYANDQHWVINRTEVVDSESYRELKVHGQDNWIHNTLSYGSPRREGENGAEAAFEIEVEHLVFEHNHVETRHWRPSMEPHKFLARRIVHTGGSVVRSFFAHNTSRNTTGLPWENKGETFLFHHNQGVWYGQAVSHRNRTTTVRSDGLIDGRRFTNIGKTGTKAYSGVVPPFAAGMHAVIAGGTGIGQIRRITWATNDSITVEEPWRVPPQADSKLVILAAYLENVLYQNNVHAFPDDIEPGYSASVGVSFDGNSFSNVVDGLDSRRAFSALMLFASTLGQSYFNEIRGLKAINTINAGVCIGYYMRNTSDTLDMLGPVMIGNAIRGCEVRIEGPQDSNDPQSIRHLGEPTDLSTKTMYPYSYGNIIEDCVSSGGRRGITSGERAVTLYRNNNVTVDNTVPQTWSIFSARSVEILDGSMGALVGNTYTQAKTTDPIYAGAPRAQLGLPVRVVRLFGKKDSSASATVPVWNIGSAWVLWDASTKTSWLSLETKNTTLAPEATSGQLAVRARMSGLAVGMHRGSIRLSMGGHVKTISVEVHVRK